MKEAGNIRFVLVRTQHPGNIGSSLRAMLNMGFGHLWLVSPVQFPDGKARALAADAAPLLDRVNVVEHLEEAIQDCRIVIGTSARDRSIDWPMLDCPTAAAKLVEAASSGPVALVFGPEPSGLTSQELYRCQYRSYVDTNPGHRSLNLSHAVQLYGWELRKIVNSKLEEQGLKDDNAPGPPARASHREIDALMAHLQELLLAVDFPRRDPADLLLRFQAIVNRAALAPQEVSMLRGLLRRIQQRIPSVPTSGDPDPN